MNHKYQLWGASAIFFFSAPVFALQGEAKIKGTAPGSDISGVVKLQDTKKGLKITASVENAPPGHHGFHIHQFGDCGNKGKNAGGHYNPHKTKHGHFGKDGKKMAHMGDLGNIKVEKDGIGTLDTVVKGLSLSGGKYSVGGRALILHAKPDDFGQPTGNAGGRIGCAPIVITGNE